MMLNRTTLGVDGFYLFAQAHKQVDKGPTTIVFEDENHEYEWTVTTHGMVDMAFFIIVTFLELEVTGVVWEG